MNTQVRRWIARRSVADQRGLVHRTGVSLVRVERPVRIVDGVLAHLTVAGDLGEDARRRHAQASQVGLDGEFDVGDRRRDEVPRAVGDGHVGNDVEPLDRPARGELLGRGHAELVALLLARRPDRPRHAPVGDPVEQRFAFTFGQQLRVAHTVHAGVPGQHRGADHQRARPTPRDRPRRCRPPGRGRAPTSPSRAPASARFSSTP